MINSQRQEAGMKRFVLAVVLTVGLGVATSVAQDAEKAPGSFSVVRVVDHGGDSTVQVLATEEIKALEATIKEEARFMAKAMGECIKDWEKDETHKGKSFPRSAIKERKIEKLAGPFNDRDKASKKADSYQKDPPDPTKEKKKETKTEDQLKKKAEREALLGEARGAFESKLAELMEATKDTGDAKRRM
jgi:hypothetical protein